MKYSDKQIEDLLQGIHAGTITEYELPEDLYYAIADYLKKGLYDGFGGTLEDFEGKELAVLEDLRTNIYQFSAAKTYQQVKDLSQQLTDGDRVRTWQEFRDIGRETFDTWNDDWGKSEYNTAIAQAQQASKWQSIEKNADILPLLQYSTNGSPCPECAPYEAFTAPVGDAIWNWLYPPMHFNCMCIVEQISEDDGTKSSKADYDKVTEWGDEHVPDTFRMNSGKDKVIFNDDSPYFDVAKKDREYAANNFDLPIPKKD